MIPAISVPAPAPYFPFFRIKKVDRVLLEDDRSAFQPSPQRDRETPHDRSRGRAKGDWHYKK
jgi:hypothetical protein